MFRFILLLSLISFSNIINAQKKLRSIAFYNVENYFDTIDGVNDDAEFLPESENKWNTEKYTEKRNHINQVFDQLNCPLIIGMCEIENEMVLRDLNFHSEKRHDYGVVHFESPDARGIDVALLYDSTALKLVESGKISFTLPAQDKPSSRDIVWGKFKRKKDTLIVLVNHWPSRRGGTEESEPNRLTAAQSARIFIDSVMLSNPEAKIILMGDLNDAPVDKAPKMIEEKLSPMIKNSCGEFGGTHNYKETWDVLDHIFVSPNLLKKQKGFKVFNESGKIHSFPFLLTEYKGQTVPFRTYGGSKYLGGYSDHLPVSIEVSIP
jgi:predicted extracellular nuclease